MTEEAMENSNEEPEVTGEEPTEDVVLETAEEAASMEVGAGESDAASEEEPAEMEEAPEAEAEASDEPVDEGEEAVEPELAAESETEDDADEDAAAEADEEPEPAEQEPEDEPEPEPEPVMAADAGEDAEAEDDEADEEPEDVEEIPDDGRAWYVIHCYSGQENKVRHNLEQRIDSMDMKGFIFDVVVPTEEEIEVKEGKRRTVERRVFPGYVLVNMLLTEESWYVVRNTPGVTGFVGMGNDPTPLRPEEVASIVKRMEADAPRIKVTFRPNERVRIVDGPFNDFHGVVDEIDMDRAKVRVLVNFFGRETPVELDFLQVEKA